MKVVSQTVAKPRIAVAEDDPDFREMLVDALHQAGFAVSEARDGRELLELLHGSARGHFHLVVTDQCMPRLAGLECLELAGSHAPFIVVSGESDQTFHAAAARLGAAAVVRKPVDLASLIELVTRLVRNEIDAREDDDAQRSVRGFAS